MRRFRRVPLFFLMLPALAGALWAALCVRAVLAEEVDTARTGTGEYRALPYSGENFQAYSRFWHTVGRCYVKDATGGAVLDAYKELETTMPDRRFAYAETGREGGGRFWPHRTHRQGLSVDFVTPVLRRQPDGSLAPDTLSCLPWNLWGYGVRLDAAGKAGDLKLDAVATIAHLDALSRAASRHGLSLKLVILDPPLQDILRASPNFRKIARLHFMGKAAWFPHDGHYHVDFAEKR